MISGSLAAQEEALALRESELRERERSGRRGFFGRGRAPEPEPVPEPPPPAARPFSNPMAGMLSRGNAAPAAPKAPAFASAAPHPAPVAAMAPPAPAPAPMAAPAAAPANDNPWA